MVGSFSGVEQSSIDDAVMIGRNLELCGSSLPRRTLLQGVALKPMQSAYGIYAGSAPRWPEFW
jgi:hypothetical protein